MIIKMIKKLTALVFAAAVFLCGCSANYSNIDGYDRIMKARELYTGLYAAHLTITDVENDLVTQELTFLYNDVDRLQYSYYGTDGKTVYREFHDGYDYSYTDENGEWVTIKEGEPNYRTYNRIARFSMTDAGMIFIKPESIESGSVTQNGSDTVITHVYRPEELSDMLSAQLGADSTLKEFTVIYTLDSAGYCTSMEQIGVSEQNGETKKVDYIMKIDSMNDIAAIIRPE